MTTLPRDCITVKWYLDILVTRVENSTCLLPTESNSLSLLVKILIPVAVCIFVAIVIVCWKYCKHENDEAKLAEVMTMVSVRQMIYYTFCSLSRFSLAESIQLIDAGIELTRHNYRH